MDYRRFNLAELSRETKTSRVILHDWIRKGWLQHVQIVGSRKKYSIAAFLSAEQKALEMANCNEQAIYKQINVVKSRVRRIPDEFFDNLDEIIAQERNKKTLPA